MNNTLYWIWLSLAFGPASRSVHKLLIDFNDDPRAIHDCEDYEKYKLTPTRQKHLCEKDLEYAEKIIRWCEDNNVGILCYDDSRYPSRLAELDDAPIVLYYIGELYDIDALFCLAGVGTRSMTSYGRDVAYSISYDLAKAGAILVSGLASGIDGCVHTAALDAGGRTIAVLGNRISKAYPACNRDLMKQIARKGLLLTEYHPFYHTTPANYPQRNRIISGLCQGTIIFEADEGSGSLITAKHAQKQGRRLYSIPGKIGDSNALGTNRLIKEGATPVTRAGDILDEFQFLYKYQLKTDRIYDYSPSKRIFDSFSKHKKETAKKVSSPKPKAVEEIEKVVYEAPDLSAYNEIELSIYNALKYDKAITVDEIILPGISTSEKLSALTMLELDGLIEELPGNRFIKK